MYTGNVALYADGVKYRTFDSPTDQVLQDYFYEYCRMIVLNEHGETTRYVPVAYWGDVRQPNMLYVDNDFVAINITPMLGLTYKACVVAHTSQSPGSCCYNQWFTIHFKDMCLRISEPTSPSGSRLSLFTIQHSEYANSIYESLSGYLYHVGNMSDNATSVDLADQALTLNTNSDYCLRVSHFGGYQMIPLEYCLPIPQYGCYYTDGEYCEVSLDSSVSICDYMWSS